MGSNRDMIMSPISRKFKTTRQLSIDPQKDYSTPLQVETSVEYDLPPHIYPPKGARPILMVHPAYEHTPLVNSNPSISTQSYSDGLYGGTFPQISSDVRKRSDIRVSCRKHMCECERCCSNSARKVSRSARLNSSLKNKMPLGDSFAANLGDVPSSLYKAPSKSMAYSAIENHLLLPEEAGFKLRVQQHHNQLNIQAQNNYSNETLWNRPILKNEQMVPIIPPQKCPFGCCNTVVPSRSEFLAPGIPPSLITRTPGRSTNTGSPKVRARSRRAVTAVNSVPDYFSATRPLRSLTSGPAMQSSLNHQRSRSNIALYSATQSQQIASTLTPKIILNPMPVPISQTATSSTVGPCRDSGCSIGTDSSCASLTSSKHFTKKLDRISLGADSGFNTPGDSPFDVHMEINDVNNNASGLYTRNTSLSSKYTSTLMNPTYAHLINLQNSLAPSVVPRYQVNSPLLQPYYIREPLLNLAY